MSEAIITSAVLFSIGVAGLLTRRDLLRILISISIMLAAIAVLAVALAVNQTFVMFLWVIEVVEIIMALAIFIYLSRNDKKDINSLTELKW
jgi:NADH-quinone oxidoreductase subunit K